MTINYKKFEYADVQFIDGDRGVNYPSKADFTKSGYCLFLNTGNVTSDGFDFSNLDFISKERDELLRKGKVDVYDIVLTTRGTVGNAAYVSDNIPYKHIRINSGMVIVRADQNKIDPYFLYSFFRSPLFKKQCLSNGSGSAQPQLPISALKNIVFPDFNLVTQQKIANILSTLDRKIALNQQINQKLEAIAKQLYDYWFVQFDFPDENGKPYKSSGGEMVWCEVLKRDVPKGWEVKTLEQVANITMGQSPKGESYNENGYGMVFFQGSTDFSWRFPSVRQYTTEPLRIAQKGDILLSVRAPVGAMNLAKSDCCIGRGLSALNSKDNFNAFLFYVMKYFEKSFSLRNSVGTTFGSITKDDLYSLTLIYPEITILKKYENIVSKYNNIILNKSDEIEKLTQLRDFLLPMLMNGQIFVE
ncbi:restriction endonuclease subunit S [Rodentibacter pneumotropicus]|uniref:Restriction endonuclease subunit S n=1 Tax=Rodentibacter pneumotropicus TaxID=758 RepID=A0A4S2Q058_9PAST|nr:restriction endonuclease subunit S [Rodentibacter pneumotropicus]THA09107.1 restriction endonuclease subunit S [Rodentibacter pneumotropicus]